MKRSGDIITLVEVQHPRWTVVI